ncbi:uncharacterized protein LAESUDRAFT_107527 [Laetiporus sulphureus 93-53]|uniref:GATA-type domain-containing protein n=1 Tax=Laetiporus sulphureus 93-53 TaxID=1314785 RepID=A0A165EMH8_9APHY|nr:uncharacterized protein LAESUDRAFT_107527 [Laetiporus sulphureus 93-53]KZT07371.1 hypothetical protein LAESUDRAFT_107527 [Laetiporus sulphureus 93-53]
MPHRVHGAERTSAHHPEDSSHYGRMHQQPTPPPIATLHHSPAMSTSSLASSSISPSPPPSTPYYQHPAPMHQAPGYPYNPNSSMSARYASDAHQTSPYAPAPHSGQVSTRAIRPSYVASQPYPGQANYIIHTDDAATKLSDRVRRKCYNCRTTDTSTWRRSSLTPGKVLCNKCGLFERTHSRPRPEQFPHKRGPVVTASFKSSRTPPPSSRLPPISTHHMHALPPHHANHPSLMPRADAMQQQQAPPPPALQQPQQGNYHNASTLPEIRSLLNTPATGSPSSTHETLDAQNRPASPAQSGTPSGGSPRSERRDSYRSTN